MDRYRKEKLHPTQGAMQGTKMVREKGRERLIQVEISEENNGKQQQKAKKAQMIDMRDASLFCTGASGNNKTSSRQGPGALVFMRRGLAVLVDTALFKS